MLRYMISAGLGVLVLCCSVWGTDEGPQVTTMRSLTSMPLAFTENQGQWDERVRFRANANGATMWFTAEGVYYQFVRRVPRLDTDSDEPFDGLQDLLDREPDSIETTMIKATFVGSNVRSRIAGQELMDYKCNYFIGNDPARWRTDVPSYKAIVYENVYPGIDLKYHGNGKQMKYDFIVAPGADPSPITVRYDGALSVHVNDDGELVVQTDWGEVVEQRPMVYQMSGGSRISLAGEYALKGNYAFGFELPDGYDANLPLVIDPTLVYSTYLGGSLFDRGYDVAVDASGCAYVTGYTHSTDFPTVDPYQADQGGYDVFVSKLSSAGDNLVYSTYLGGDGAEWGWGVDVDTSGCAYVAGRTTSVDFPTVNPYQTDQGSDDVFVAKLSVAGNNLVYSTYLGGNDGDYGFAIAVDASGFAYVIGYSASTNFPAVNPYQPDQGGYDVFVSKLSGAGNDLVYSTYLGGNDGDYGFAIAVDASGCAHVTGYTRSTDFPTADPYQPDQEGFDAFVTKLSSAGDNLVYSTYLGGSDAEFGWGMAVDATSCAYVTGYTYSADFPTVDPYQLYQGDRDVFAAKLSSTGNNLVYSTYLGGGSGDQGSDIAVDASGCAYVTGRTGSTDFPTVDPYQSDQGDDDAFVAKLSSSGSSLDYSTYLGGNDMDWGYGVAVDSSGCVYVTGETSSSDFPTTPDAYDTSYNGGGDAFVAKLCFAGDCCNHDGKRGDVNYDSEGPNIVDLTYLVAYLFGGGAEPPCPEEADVNADGDTNIVDLTYIVAHLFGGGSPPEPCP